MVRGSYGIVSFWTSNWQSYFAFKLFLVERILGTFLYIIAFKISRTISHCCYIQTSSVYQCFSCILSVMFQMISGTSRIIGLGCAARFPKPLPYLWPKFATFSTLFMTFPKLWNPTFDRCGWHSCPKHNLWRTFVDGLTDIDEKK